MNVLYILKREHWTFFFFAQMSNFRQCHGHLPLIAFMPKWQSMLWYKILIFVISSEDAAYLHNLWTPMGGMHFVISFPLGQGKNPITDFHAQHQDSPRGMSVNRRFIFVSAVNSTFWNGWFKVIWNLLTWCHFSRVY